MLWSRSTARAVGVAGPALCNYLAYGVSAFLAHYGIVIGSQPQVACSEENR